MYASMIDSMISPQESSTIYSYRGRDWVTDE